MLPASATPKMPGCSSSDAVAAPKPAATAYPAGQPSTSASPNGAAPPYTCPAPSRAPPAADAACHSHTEVRTPGTHRIGGAPPAESRSRCLVKTAIQMPPYPMLVTGKLYHTAGVFLVEI